jgi:hypothetical protein
MQCARTPLVEKALQRPALSPLQIGEEARRAGRRLVDKALQRPALSPLQSGEEARRAGRRLVDRDLQRHALSPLQSGEEARRADCLLVRKARCKPILRTITQEQNQRKRAKTRLHRMWSTLHLAQTTFATNTKIEDFLLKFGIMTIQRRR